MLHFLVLKVGKHKMGMIRGMKRIGKIKEIEKIEGVRGMEEIIAEIK